MRNQPSRRLFLAAGSAGAAFASLSAAVAATPADPLAVLIREHDEAVAYYNANAPEDDDLADAMADATFIPPFRILIQNPPRPTTMAGAIAGLEFLAREKLTEDDAAPVFGVCLDYLRSHCAA